MFSGIVMCFGDPSANGTFDLELTSHDSSACGYGYTSAYWNYVISLSSGGILTIAVPNAFLFNGVVTATPADCRPVFDGTTYNNANTCGFGGFPGGGGTCTITIL